MPLVACAAPSTAHRALCPRSRLRLCLQTCRCGFSAAFHSGQTTGASSTGAPRSKSVPKNSLQLLAIPQSLDQWGGICVFELHVMLQYTRSEYDAFSFTSHRGLVRFGRACADGQREEAYCGGATSAARVPERRSERLAGFRPSGPTGHSRMVVDERHIHHFGALGGPRRG